MAVSRTRSAATKAEEDSSESPKDLAIHEVEYTIEEAVGLATSLACAQEFRWIHTPWFMPALPESTMAKITKLLDGKFRDRRGRYLTPKHAMALGYLGNAFPKEKTPNLYVVFPHLEKDMTEAHEIIEGYLEC
ncbi:hypothetical protein BCR34DRAFT_606185 [Clohesyomyces aquaticus]|uniref:Uncharacterized protein n=1 Tax=Clohesyomyces aquaticus TaxID=1231657 RepID=A0A1Y1YSW2_9PLEO|nr:hypothetical protein BCR34DRAFT_606185 [Clohesyomyces aquaticus]